MSEILKMKAGEPYCCLDPTLDAMRHTARMAVYQHNTLSPDKRGAIGPLLRGLFGARDETTFIEAPFHCAYGVHIRLGKNVYLNAGCTILDTGPVTIGAASLLGPNVQIFCAEHDKNPARRKAGLEVARPVTIGKNVWVGGGAIILAGVEIGDDAIVGAGSVVTKSVPAGATVVGNPARIR